MPKQVDYEERRRRIAQAVCVLAGDHGPEGVGLRDVAARARVSLGAVQRCFRSKEQMLLFAVGHVGERVLERVRAGEADGGDRSAAAVLERAATEVALLRAEHRSEARIWLAFVARAAVSPPLAEALRSSYAALEELFVRLVAEAATEAAHAEGGAAGSAAAYRREARALIALADGLTGHVVLGHLTEEEAGSTLRTQLAALRERLGGSVPSAGVPDCRT
ncbi:TetR family transcriptional regulator [Streptomyces sp. Amel2xB2]|uniref:TetR/AcrR family transcriptional regulator n=1 Tax=Streptomyces sp. Amel2xB2 TaxID=1305829 RepID=UPI000DB9052D|nr:TetR family transcriptional regulator C-terminal domain-containing protein [Streptomyces sp. Amel2xB2]RAJ66629.1 TetR family transcriptional regulator [Streptomyces sp. Amel2xB2]